MGGVRVAAGQHVVQLFVQYAPYDVNPKVGSWADPGFKEGFVRRCLSVVDEFAPGFSGSVLGVDALSPLDLERVFGLHKVRVRGRAPAPRARCRRSYRPACQNCAQVFWEGRREREGDRVVGSAEAEQCTATTADTPLRASPVVVSPVRVLTARCVYLCRATSSTAHSHCTSWLTRAQRPASARTARPSRCAA